ncbi:hypothetical protein BJ742DRAFT_548271 [Cladochytrium replicatum]|nr:hypothetical protein BJ742DRAFT_548271 [Cladochytrium replicatum]
MRTIFLNIFFWGGFTFHLRQAIMFTSAKANIIYFAFQKCERMPFTICFLSSFVRSAFYFFFSI